ncbi:hypothetical protein N9Z12_00755 [Opitutaceae bacterium]|nr:hypothetical protein [Opitutaceae bacterium]
MKDEMKMRVLKTNLWMGGFLAMAVAGEVVAADVTDIGSRRELFVDEALIERLEGGAELRLHHPVPKEIVLEHDEPWEGTGSGYHSVFQDGDLYRMYYKSWNISPFDEANPGESMAHPRLCAYAESDDGIHWRKPSLGLHEFDGSTDNNIVLIQEKMGELELDAAHPAVFLDTNPDAPPDARYKAIIRQMSHPESTLIALKSPDGIHWSLLHDEPIITDGKFDSQNLAFWDEAAGCYRAYWRYFIPDENDYWMGSRAIRTATSQDFIHWENTEDLSYEDSPLEQLYTNVIKPYHRAPHLLLGFPARYLERGHEDKTAEARAALDEMEHQERVAQWSDSLRALPELDARIDRGRASERYGAALTDTLLMSSRDGVVFKRWNEAFLQPGMERPGTWHYGQQYMAWHVVETQSDLPGAPNELSMYAVESYWTAPGSALRRYTLRLDGFVSLRAPSSGGELVTKPIRFEGAQLALNFATSAAGSVRVEIQDESGQPLSGFALADCAPLYGNTVDRAIAWTSDRKLSELAGQAVRLRFVLHDADVYAYRFQP